MRRTAHLSAALLLTALVLTGCTTPTPMPTAPPEPSIAPVFASDEEALAAAEEAYGRFLETVDAILASGGSDPERLRPLVSDSMFEKELEGFVTLQSRGWHGVGLRTFTLTLQSYDESEVHVYACDDVSATDVVDSGGASMVADGRLAQYPFEVTFELNAGTLIVAAKELWNGGGVC